MLLRCPSRVRSGLFGPATTYVISVNTVPVEQVQSRLGPLVNARFLAPRRRSGTCLADGEVPRFCLRRRGGMEIRARASFP